MTDQDHTPDAEAARAALDSASKLRVVSDREIRTLRGVLVGIALGMSFILVFMRLAGDNPWVFGFTIAAYGIALVVLMRWQTTVRAVPRGYGKWYGMGVGGVSALYAVGIALDGLDLPWIVVGLIVVAMIAVAVFCASKIRAAR